MIESPAGPEVTIAWQGGEATLVGLEFFQRAVGPVDRFSGPAGPGGELTADCRLYSAICSCVVDDCSNGQVAISCCDGGRDLDVTINSISTVPSGQRRGPIIRKVSQNSIIRPDGGMAQATPRHRFRRGAHFHRRTATMAPANPHRPTTRRSCQAHGEAPFWTSKGANTAAMKLWTGK